MKILIKKVAPTEEIRIYFLEQILIFILFMWKPSMKWFQRSIHIRPFGIDRVICISLLNIFVNFYLISMWKWKCWLTTISIYYMSKQCQLTQPFVIVTPSIHRKTMMQSIVFTKFVFRVNRREQRKKSSQELSVNPIKHHGDWRFTVNLFTHFFLRK